MPVPVLSGDHSILRRFPADKDAHKEAHGVSRLTSRTFVSGVREPLVRVTT